MARETLSSPRPSLPDSRQAVMRLLVTLALMTIGTTGMYIMAVVLPAVQADFNSGRGVASLPYTIMMVGFGLGGILMGYLSDRHGVTAPLLVGAVGLGSGYILSAMAGNIWVFIALHGLLLGALGGACAFAPLVADTSLWFVRYRGLAVAVAASGNYLSGTIAPPIVQHFVQEVGWRQTYVYLGLFSLVTMAGLAMLMRAPPPKDHGGVPQGKNRPRHLARAAAASDRPFGMSPGRAQLLLSIAGVACCVAMAMPQVHIVAYCMDLGFSPARGAEMLSLMLACGIASRLFFGAVCDRIGGLRTLLLTSFLQMIALFMFLPTRGLVSLYVVSAMFGLFQGGIVPTYAIIVREYFSPREAGARVGTVIMATMLGMALGGWLPGKVYDATHSYFMAFVFCIGWNLLNLGIVAYLFYRSRPSAPTAGAPVRAT
ncbi:MFS transporter [Pusillimonas noertemannii]|uniref:Putative MFS family arabinose efflux permease n=1 Tax=Pusillimonas noertemannii TaxID=305977 RepID=A0A2U1CN48_9BURK|nr:MFS transporter [Pusillimonas noertemannii]PVY62377.1 putative MFS family arabinose efflux permease [Pusillimonas noertemannii]TFL10656.1 MFS transporter [Pusillimonas noertemannii]